MGSIACQAEMAWAGSVPYRATTDLMPAFWIMPLATSTKAQMSPTTVATWARTGLVLQARWSVKASMARTMPKMTYVNR